MKNVLRTAAIGLTVALGLTGAAMSSADASVNAGFGLVLAHSPGGHGHMHRGGHHKRLHRGGHRFRMVKPRVFPRNRILRHAPRHHILRHAPRRHILRRVLPHRSYRPRIHIPGGVFPRHRKVYRAPHRRQYALCTTPTALRRAASVGMSYARVERLTARIVSVYGHKNGSNARLTMKRHSPACAIIGFSYVY